MHIWLYFTVCSARVILKHVATFGHLFGRLSPLFGLKVETRKPADAESYGNAIYIANHQNNYDMVTASNIVQPPTVTVG
ncbi:1-acyl-sn-glycerol-3-phosphate acyltransferase [Raoultella ornithinolytica]|nr:1-acyl-sn-glycerol-3-phosphate acyltransferase [Raoultella ornithinolytica]